jgi:hypothetical protein
LYLLRFARSTQDGEHAELKKYGGFWHGVMSGLIKVVLWGAYIVIRIRYRGKEKTEKDSSQIETIPDKPISSVQLSFALDPKSPKEKLIGLVNHESYIIRRALARNPSLPGEHREILRKDANSKVAEEVETLYPTPKQENSG